MPPIPAPASTLILLRAGERRPEVLLLLRHAASAFLPDMYVFPGGRVEPGDAALCERASGVSEANAREALRSVGTDCALTFYVAAIRETFEEAGVLLARRRGEHALIDGAHAARLSAHRLEVQAGRLPFHELIDGENLELAADLLTVHAHWITPESVARRFDTVFFTTAAPAGQHAAHDGVESTSHVWLPPESALAQSRTGERRMIFPTACNLETLCGFATVDDALAASRVRPVVAVLPRYEERDGERVLVIPDEAGYSTQRDAWRSA
jgi:8-oxo-dGTP pyrophosphatase MutT (NUDIX family)